MVRDGFVKALLLGAALAALAALTVLGGCGGSLGQGASLASHGDERPAISGSAGDVSSARADTRAVASETTFNGWKALTLSNGLVTVTAVPTVGGRILEYKLGSQALLWQNPKEAGKLYEAPRTKEQRAWHNFGGYKVWPAPQSEWGGPPDPLGSSLDGGRWDGHILISSGDSAVIEMTSPEDPAVTGLQITRRVTLFVGTTHVQIRETFKNVSKREITWSIWSVTQVPGDLRGDGKPSSQAKVYLPLNPKSKQAGGYYAFPDYRADEWKKIAQDKILETTYQGKPGKIGADSDGGWVASVDDLHGVTFAQTFAYNPEGTYPDSGSTVEVWTNPGDLPYMEVEVLSPLTKLQPGESFSAERNWFCAKLGGPVVKVTDVAALKTHPSAAKQGKQIVVTGEIGVFAPGDVALAFTGADGVSLGLSKPVSLTPVSAGSLKITADLPDGATKAMLVLLDPKGSRIGDIAQVPLAAGLAKAP